MDGCDMACIKLKWIKKLKNTIWEYSGHAETGFGNSLILWILCIDFFAPKISG